MKSRPTRMFASDLAHGRYFYGAVLTRAVKHSAHFDAAALQPLKTVRHHLPDFIDHDQRILDVHRTLRNHPRSEFRLAHVDRPGRRPGTGVTINATPSEFSPS